VLPPRALTDGVTHKQARSFLDDHAGLFRPFMIRAAHVEVFPITNVVYIALSRGWQELTEMHEELNRQELQATENFRYQPHITLAQGLMPEQAMEIAAHAQRRWNDFTDGRGFKADTLTFVQNTRQNRWIDLAEFALGELAPSHP
jgi:2'-5' RNA ligase